MSNCFFGANEVTRKTKKLEKKSAAFRVGGIIADFGVQSLDGVVEPPGLKQLLD